VEIPTVAEQFGAVVFVFYVQGVTPEQVQDLGESVGGPVWYGGGQD
jgi:hypothetical protein